MHKATAKLQECLLFKEDSIPLILHIASIASGGSKMPSVATVVSAKMGLGIVLKRYRREAAQK